MVLLKNVQIVAAITAVLVWQISGQPVPAPNPQPENQQPAPAPNPQPGNQQPAPAPNQQPLPPVAPQPSVSINPVTVTSPSVEPTPSCNPYVETCEGADCADALNLGRVRIFSPNSSAYFYVGLPLFVNWTYDGLTDARFPVNSVNLYYKPRKEKTWIEFAVVGRRNKTHTWNVPKLVPGSYEMLIVPDNVDKGGAVGTRPSCLADGFPVADKVTFRFLNFNSRDSFADDKYAPSISENQAVAVKGWLGYLWTITAGIIYAFL